MHKTLKQWEILFNMVAKELGVDLKSIQMQAFIAANGKTFKQMMYKLDKLVMEKEGKSYIRVNMGSEYAYQPLFEKLCSEVFEVPEYSITNILKAYNQKRLGEE